MPTPFSATLAVGTDTLISAATFADSVPNVGLFFSVSSSFWAFSGTWVDGTTNHATPGNPGRGAKLPGGKYSVKLLDNETLKLRGVVGGEVVEGLATAL